MASRRSKRKSKQRRHQAGSPQGHSAQQASSAQADADTSGKTGKEPSTVTKAVKKAGQKKFTSASPLTSAGALDWTAVKLPFPEPPPQRDPAPMTSREMPSPGASVAMAIICTLGIIMTGRWSLVLLAVLGAVLLLDSQVRINRDLLLRIAGAVVLCAVCMPLISDATSDISFQGQGAVGGIVVLMFSAALWLLGGVCRRAARLQDSPFRQGGLYVVGMACQILSLIVLALGTVLMFLFLIAQV